AAGGRGVGLAGLQADRPTAGDLRHHGEGARAGRGDDRARPDRRAVVRGQTEAILSSHPGSLLSARGRVWGGTPVGPTAPHRDATSVTPARAGAAQEVGARGRGSWNGLRPLGDPRGRPELPWGGADEALEVAGELALVREPGVGGHLRQGEVTGLA